MSTDPSFPAENIIDENLTTAWKLNDASITGWVEFNFSTKQQIYGVFIDALFADDVELRIE